MANFDRLLLSDLLINDDGPIADVFIEGLRTAQVDEPETVAELLDLIPNTKATYTQSEDGIAEELERAARVKESVQSGTFGGPSAIEAIRSSVRLARGSFSYSAEDGIWVRFTSDGGHSIDVVTWLRPPAGPAWVALDFRGMLVQLLGWMADDGDLDIPTYSGTPGPDFARYILNGLVLRGLDLRVDPRIPEESRDVFRLAFQDAYLSLGGQLEMTINAVPFNEWIPEFLGAHRGDVPERGTVLGILGERFAERAGPTLPEPRLVKTAALAEEYAAEVMRALGFYDASTTPPGCDGGIDVVSADAVAQVKMEGLPTGRPVLQALFGAASVDGKRAVFFSLAGYTTQALEWAERAAIACFEFAFDGSIEARTPAAEHLLSAGFQP